MLEKFARWLGLNVKLPGIIRVIRAIFPYRHDATRFVVGTRRRLDGLLMQLDSRNFVDWNVIFRGAYEAELADFMSQLIEPAGVAVDIGANIGVHTLTMARAVGPKGRVLAFEPNPIVRTSLSLNIALNELRNVAVYDCALGDHPGIMPLRVPKFGTPEYANMGLASLYALETPHDSIDVLIRTFDEIAEETRIGHVDLIKIDVQGYECQVLAGMQQVLSIHAPAVLLEFEEWAWKKSGAQLSDAAAIFSSVGYCMFELRTELGVALDPLDDARLRKVRGHVDILAMKYSDSRLQQFTPR